MSNMLRTIVPKSDQQNADDLIGRTMTIKITKVDVKEDATEQSVWIYFEGDKGKPYKPSKGMRRVLVHGWGADSNQYTGRSMTLYRDADVRWAGEAVGGIAISHMSHIEHAFTLALTVSKGKRKQHRVEVLATERPAPATPPPTVAEYETCDGPGYKLLEERRKQHVGSLPQAVRDELRAAKEAAFERLKGTTKTSAPPPALDSDALLAALQRPADFAALEVTWARVIDFFDGKGKEVPVEFDAAYQLSKEQFGQ